MNHIKPAFLVSSHLLILLSNISFTPTVDAATKVYERPEYLTIKKKLVRGWGTWDSRNMLKQVLLPESLSINMAFKQTGWRGYRYFERALILQRTDVEIKPGLHALDGSYSEVEIRWHDVHLRVETASDQDRLVILVTPLNQPKLPLEAVVSTGMLWNRPGLLSREADQLVAKLPSRIIRVYTTGQEVSDPYVQADTPYLSLELDQELGISTNEPLGVKQIRSILQNKQSGLEKEATQHGKLAAAYNAIQSGIAWNTIYEPKFDRLITTMARPWNERYGGFIVFGWDNFFISYASSLISKDLAYANFAEHMRSMTEGGFIPNDDRGNGTKSWDHSQPPVGSIMLKEIFKRYRDRWLLEASFDDLLTWNRWWLKSRLNGDLLSHGSDLARNPYKQEDIHTWTTAAYESGMDDSPMYDEVPFNPEKNMLELQDVGLNSLYIADCNALAEIAEVLGRTNDVHELHTRAEQFSKAMAILWDKETGLYLNRRTDTGELSKRMSPTMFYPLLARLPQPERAESMVENHLLNPTEFGGEYVIPSIARDDPSFPKEANWKGAVWPPLNFLVYLSLRNYNLPQARHELAVKSREMFLQEWNRSGFIRENYSAIMRTGDDSKLNSDQFYSWGTLMGLISFIEAAELPPPEMPISGQRR